MYIGIGYILVSDIFCQKLGIYSDMGYILPTIGRYILVLDIFCQQLADILWYWIYSANNWEIYVNYGVFVRPSGAGLQIVHLLECVCFKKKHILQPYTLQLTYIPQLLAEYIQYQYINSSYIYSPMVGRIYPIPICKFN